LPILAADHAPDSFHSGSRQSAAPCQAGGPTDLARQLLLLARALCGAKKTETSLRCALLFLHITSLATHLITSSIPLCTNTHQTKVVLWTACLLSSSTGARADSVAGHGYLRRETVRCVCARCVRGDEVG
jgi:hypothetical protein